MWSKRGKSIQLEIEHKEKVAILKKNSSSKSIIIIAETPIIRMKYINGFLIKHIII